MNQVSRKIGFWSVFALVTGSQIGSGVFMLPANLASFGLFALVGWIISGIGAIALALVFAQLCSWFPKTGGPHVYVKEAFWIINWFLYRLDILGNFMGQYNSCYYCKCWLFNTTHRSSFFNG